jgi:anion-transporting  ArsA/GET3 family ATPase
MGTLDLATLLETKEIIITCGPGGVGKTTTAAAAAAIAAARQGGRVLVLTVDPARRLADALGVAGIGNDVVSVDPSLFSQAGVEPRGTLSAAMLDTKKSWDELITRHAPNEVTRNRILTNPLYTSLTTRFVQSHDYIAMERLYELHGTGEWDLIVVDTPPTRNALDFLDAPARMADFFSSRLLRWLTMPARSGLLGLASRGFAQVADRILGRQFLADITEFFGSLESMYEGFVERSQAVSRLLGDERTAFMVVSSSELVPLREATFFVDQLQKRNFTLAAVVLNRVLPSSLADSAAADAASAMTARRDALAEALSKECDVDQAVGYRVLDAMVESYSDLSVIAHREALARAHFPIGSASLVEVPLFDEDIHDLAGLLRLGEYLIAKR